MQIVTRERADGAAHVRRLILDSTCKESWDGSSGKAFGDAPLAAMTPQAVAVLRDRKKGYPEAAKGRLTATGGVFDWAMDAGQKDCRCRVEPFEKIIDAGPCGDLTFPVTESGSRSA